MYKEHSSDSCKCLFALRHSMNGGIMLMRAESHSKGSLRYWEDAGSDFHKNNFLRSIQSSRRYPLVCSEGTSLNGLSTFQ